MERRGVAKMVIEAISEATGIGEEQIDGDKTLIQNGADSLDTIEVINNLESKFGIEIPDCEFMEKKSLTVDGIVDLVLRLLPTAVAVA